MNRHAIAAFSATGLTATAVSSRSRHRFVVPAPSTCTETQLSAHHPLGMRARPRSGAILTEGPLHWLGDHFGEMIAGCLRSKNSVSPTVSLPISSICACNSGGSSLRSPSRASASEVKYMTMV